MPLIETHILKVEKEVGQEWGTVHLDHGEVKKVTTKRGDLLADAAKFKQSGVLVGLEYTERSKNVDGRTYVNRYLENVGSLGGNGAGPADDGIDIVQPQSRGEDPLRSWRICLQSGAKCAIATLPFLPETQREVEHQKTMARAWAEFFYFTPPPDTQTAGTYSEPVGLEQPPPLDESDAFPF